MRSILRDLETVKGVECGFIVRSGEVLASTFPEDKAGVPASSAQIVARISEGLKSAGRAVEELSFTVDGKSLHVAPVADDFIVAVLSDAEADASLLGVAMQSSARQIRIMADLPVPEPEPAPQPESEPESEPETEPEPAPTPEPAPEPKVAASDSKKKRGGRRKGGGDDELVWDDEARSSKARAEEAARAQAEAKAEPDPGSADAEPLLPQVLKLLTEAIGPVAKITFKRGVADWKEAGPATVGNLGELAKILAADLSTDEERQSFMDAVAKLAGS